jgi:hypothetical protein
MSSGRNRPFGVELLSLSAMIENVFTETSEKATLGRTDSITIIYLRYVDDILAA